MLGMNIDGLVSKYFGECDSLPIIEMFDSESIHAVYKNVVDMLKMQMDIELGVLQIFSYCLYEILDNVITHSTKSCGMVVLKYSPEDTKIQIMVVDDGIGIHRSLTQNEIYKDVSEEESLMRCMQDKVTDGKGMGFGLYSLACAMRQVGVVLKLHSGSHILISDGKGNSVKATDFWQGTIMYFELCSDREIDPNSVLENRTDAVSEFNDEFMESDDIYNLW